MYKLITTALALALIPTVSATRSDTLLKSWDFSKDSISWNRVSIPHDWAIYGLSLIHI